MVGEPSHFTIWANFFLRDSTQNFGSCPSLLTCDGPEPNQVASWLESGRFSPARLGSSSKFWLVPITKFNPLMNSQPSNIPLGYGDPYAQLYYGFVCNLIVYKCDILLLRSKDSSDVNTLSTPF